MNASPRWWWWRWSLLVALGGVGLCGLSLSKPLVLVLDRTAGCACRSVVLRHFDRLRGHLRRGVRIRLGHRDPRGAQDPVAHLVAGLQDLDAGRASDPRGVRMQQRLMDVRIEGISLLTERNKPVLAGDPLDLVADRLERPGQLAVLPSRPQVVQYREQILEDPLDA